MYGIYNNKYVVINVQINKGDIDKCVVIILNGKSVKVPLVKQ